MMSMKWSNVYVVSLSLLYWHLTRQPPCSAKNITRNSLLTSANFSLISNRSSVVNLFNLFITLFDAIFRVFVYMVVFLENHSHLQTQWIGFGNFCFVALSTTRTHFTFFVFTDGQNHTKKRVFFPVSVVFTLRKAQLRQLQNYVFADAEYDFKLTFIFALPYGVVKMVASTKNCRVSSSLLTWYCELLRLP